MRTMLISTLSMIVFGAASCAQTPDAPDAATASSGTSRQCFMVSTIRGFSSQGDGAIVVRASQRASYELRAVGYCHDIDWANQVALRPFGGSSNLCVGDQADLIIGASGGAVERCRVEVTRRAPEDGAEPARGLQEG